MEKWIENAGNRHILEGGKSLWIEVEPNYWEFVGKRYRTLADWRRIQPGFRVR